MASEDPRSGCRDPGYRGAGGPRGPDRLPWMPSSTWEPARTPKRARSRPATPSRGTTAARSPASSGASPPPRSRPSFDSTILQRVQQAFSLERSSHHPDRRSLGRRRPHPQPGVEHRQQHPERCDRDDRTWGQRLQLHRPDRADAQNLDQLEWIVAHNLSHELMLAFGVGENYDHTGNYIDAPVANWAMMTSPNATFSPAAAGCRPGRRASAASRPPSPSSAPSGPESSVQPVRANWTARNPSYRAGHPGRLGPRGHRSRHPQPAHPVMSREI